MKITFLSLMCMVMFCSGPLHAYAVPLTFAYEGAVNGANGTTPSNAPLFQAMIGETLRIEFSFEMDPVLNPDQNSNLGSGAYALLSMTLSVAGLTWTTGGGNIFVGDADPSQVNLFDGYRVTSNVAIFSGPQLGGTQLVFVDFVLRDPTRTAFSNDFLPLIPPNPSAFGGDPTGQGRNEIQLAFADKMNATFGGLAVHDNSPFNLSSLPTNSPITTATPSTVPEPSTFLLLGTGLAGLIVWRVKNPNMCRKRG
ncbi:MAG: PEP-CTERM sorting domain-containing protein [Nitrospirales bacterium]|nr:PEP-CTERM sorting domain-containing protein [Nitrospirales bacterium]